LRKTLANKFDYLLLFSLLILLLGGIISTFYIWAGSHRKSAEDSIRLGFIGPLTGPAASYGVAQMRGVMLAEKEINASGGINGKKFQIIFEDSQMDPNKSVSSMKKLVDIDRVPAVIGETSTTATLAIADIANRSKTILLSPLASGSKLTDAGDYIFRLSPADTFQALIMAKYLYKRGLKNGCIIYTNDDWGGGLQKAFQKDFERLGGVILLSEGVTPGTQDFRTLLVKIKTLQPEFVFIPLHPNESAIFLRQVKELKVPAQIVGGDNFSEKAILATAGSAADGVIFAMAAQPNGKAFKKFTQNYKAKFNEDPSYSAAAAYDSAYLLAEAIKKSGNSGEQIKKALYETKNYEGASGSIGFDQHGDVTTKSFEIIQIKNGQYNPLSNPE
jgi:branched-chain amino acid transport system substrate-binding protein